VWLLLLLLVVVLVLVVLIMLLLASSWAVASAFTQVALRPFGGHLQGLIALQRGLFRGDAVAVNIWG
jgi:hypothetical protein